MKTTWFFHLTFLLLSCVFMEDSLAREHTRLILPNGTRARFGEAVLTGEIAYSPNGAWLAAPSTIGIWLYSARTGRLKAHLDKGFVRSVAFAPDSRTLAGNSDGEIRLWKVSTGKLKATLDEPAGFVRSMAFARDGKTLASGGGDHTIRLWEVRTGQLRNTLEEHTGEVEALAFSPDRKTLASAGGDYTIRLWNAGTGQLRNTLEGHTGWIQAVAFSPDGKTLASGQLGRDDPVLGRRHRRSGDYLGGIYGGGTCRMGMVPGVRAGRQYPGQRSRPRGPAVGTWRPDSSGPPLPSMDMRAGSLRWRSPPDGNTLASGSRSRSGSESSHFSVVLWDLAPRTKVEAAVLGGMVEGLTVEFSRAIAGRRRHYVWRAVTDTAGRLELTLFPGVSGFYEARALTAAGKVVGQWHSIPLNSDERQFLELTLGGGMQVVSVEPLAAAKVAAPEGLVASELHPNTPNPFNAGTRIAYRLAASGPVRLEIYNLLGQQVHTLVDETQAAGAYRVSWDARDRRRAAVAAGIYFTRLTWPGGEQTRRLIYLK